jgi:lipid II:glycine glycyltransferase (peptidoglycan interpeptide bridge formation enzyme)
MKQDLIEVKKFHIKNLKTFLNLMRMIEKRKNLKETSKK